MSNRYAAHASTPTLSLDEV